MKAAKVSELKAGLSKYLARVKRGEQVLITERGRTIAKIVPVLRSESAEEEHILELERLGIALPSKYPGVPPEYWALKLPEDPEGKVLKGFLRDREEER